MYVIRNVGENEFPACLAVIRESFETVAQAFSLTRENCPSHTSFMTYERLLGNAARGWRFFAAEQDGVLVGCYALSREVEDSFELHNLAVLPAYRHRGLGRRLLDDAKARVCAAGAKKLCIGIIEESAVLKRWYMENGFVPTGTRRFPHLPFTVGFLEWQAGGAPAGEGRTPCGR